MESFVLGATWVLPISGPPIRDGVVAVEGGKIGWVGPRRDLPSRLLRARIRAFPGSLLLPGWVNPYCRLDLTAALGGIPVGPGGVPEWIERVDRIRRSWPEAIVRQAVKAGLDLLLSTGTTTVGDVAERPELEPFLTHPMRTLLFHEPRAPSPEDAEQRLAEAERWLFDSGRALSGEEPGRLGLGLACAPPSWASTALRAGVAAMARGRSLRLVVTTGWSAEMQGLSTTPEVGSRALVAPCLRLSEGELTRLGPEGPYPVWCPGAQRHFGYSGPDLAALRERSGSVALCTAGLAENTGLSMLREVRLAAELEPGVPPEHWIRSATLEAARVLGLERQVGSLEPGKLADLQLLSGAPEDAHEPMGPLFEARLQVAAVLVNGKQAWGQARVGQAGHSQQTAR
jgi:cytosine/adenosine deaminase-related metal-dependent hydrolase